MPVAGTRAEFERAGRKLSGGRGDGAANYREAGNGRFCAFGEIEKAVADESRRP